MKKVKVTDAETLELSEEIDNDSNVSEALREESVDKVEEVETL